MKRHTTRLNQQEQEAAAQQRNTQDQATIQFNTAEEVLRHDCTRIRVPSAVAERLRESVNTEPKPARSWWKRWMGD
jgi:hypothetical protein